jgi:hypothetical protein
LRKKENSHFLQHTLTVSVSTQTSDVNSECTQ